MFLDRIFSNFFPGNVAKQLPQKNMSFLFNFLGIFPTWDSGMGDTAWAIIPINPVLDPSVSKCKSLEGSTRSSLISCSSVLQKPELVAVAIVF